MIERLVLATARLPGASRGAARVVLNGVALGVLSDDRLRALDERYYAQEDLYRTREWNERGLTPWERAVVSEILEPGGRVYVVGCGGGREVKGLLDAGYEATGCESHPALRAFAQSWLPGRVEAAPRDELPPGDAVDAVLVGWGAYGLIHGSRARIALLRAARARAPVIALSCFGVAVHGRELRWTARLANALGRGKGLPVGTTLAPNRVHVFTRAQLAEEAQAAGLELEQWTAVAPAQDAISHHAAVLR